MRRTLDQIASVLRYRQLLWALVSRDLRVRYKRSVLGVFWAFAEPLILTALFTVVFSVLLRFSTPNYPIFALCGVIAWNFFHTGVTYSLSAVSVHANLVKKIYFPREILPIATVLGRFVHCLLSWLLFLPLLLFFHVSAHMDLLLVPVVLILQLVLVLGLAMLFSAVSTLYEDVAFLVNFAFTGLFYLSPVFYSVDIVPARLRPYFLLNPMAAIITALRSMILASGPVPWASLGYAAVVAVFLFAAGLWVFRLLSPQFAEVL